MSPNDERRYALWLRDNEARGAEPSSPDSRVKAASLQFSLITHAARPDSLCEETSASVRNQNYPHWEWIVTVPAGSAHEDALGSAGFLRDERIRLVPVPSHVSEASAWNIALREARGTFAALLGGRDTLSASALHEMARAIDRNPAADVLYSDEDLVDEQSGRRHTPRFKPDWSPDVLLACNYIGRLSVFRVATVLAAGGFDDAHGGEEWGLWLRLSRGGAHIQRVPRCLYHAASPAPTLESAAAQDLLRRHCEQLGMQEVNVRTEANRARVTWRVPGTPLVSVIIPNRNAAAVLEKCVRGLLEDTDYPRRELVIVDNESTEPDALELYNRLEREGARIVPYGRQFNYSAACNRGAAAARGDLFLFLNNDIEVLDHDWLEELARWAQLPGVGIVGGKLVYPNRLIQHAGVVFGIGLVDHIFARAPESTFGVFGSSDWYRNYLAVTGACQMVRKEVFARLGGYDERFRLSFSDVVLCMEARKAGYRIVYTPYARLVHHESYTRKREDSPEDMGLLAEYLRAAGFVEDPYFHPELSANSSIPAVRLPFEPPPVRVVNDYVDRVLASMQVVRH
jgi:GT2 family glycosyltransferase